IIQGPGLALPRLCPCLSYSSPGLVAASAQARHDMNCQRSPHPHSYFCFFLPSFLARPAVLPLFGIACCSDQPRTLPLVAHRLQALSFFGLREILIRMQIHIQIRFLRPRGILGSGSGSGLGSGSARGGVVRAERVGGRSTFDGGHSPLPDELPPPAAASWFTPPIPHSQPPDSRLPTPNSLLPSGTYFFRVPAYPGPGPCLGGWVVDDSRLADSTAPTLVRRVVRRGTDTSRVRYAPRPGPGTSGIRAGWLGWGWAGLHWGEASAITIHGPLLSSPLLISLPASRAAPSCTHSSTQSFFWLDLTARRRDPACFLPSLAVRYPALYREVEVDVDRHESRRKPAGGVRVYLDGISAGSLGGTQAGEK
ncbi:hypothetical protein C8F04DRAFT_1345586, partial [Mycena alexandri]